MHRITKHIMIPATVSLIFFIIASLPDEIISCRHCGLIAAIFAIASGVLAIGAAVKVLTGQIRRDANSSFWMASALIFAIPVIFIVVRAT